MTQAPAPAFKIPTKNPQPARSGALRASGRARASRPVAGQVRASGTGRAATRGGGEVIELEYGITVYPARVGGITAFVVEGAAAGITVERRTAFMGLRGLETG